jgi:hypothetical protein
MVDIAVSSDVDVDAIRDTLADLQLPLTRLSSRLGSLDEVYLERADHGLAPSGNGHRAEQRT